MIEALGHPLFYLGFWLIILIYASVWLWRIERLLVSISTSLLAMLPAKHEHRGPYTDGPEPIRCAICGQSMDLP